MNYRRLEKDELLQANDQTDRCVDAWRDYPIWEFINKLDIGKKVPDPKYIAHTQYRRPIEE